MWLISSTAQASGDGVVEQRHEAEADVAAEDVRRAAAVKIASTSEVVVVLPLEPVMPTTGPGNRSRKRLVIDSTRHAALPSRHDGRVSQRHALRDADEVGAGDIGRVVARRGRSATPRRSSASARSPSGVAALRVADGDAGAVAGEVAREVLALDAEADDASTLSFAVARFAAYTVIASYLIYARPARCRRGRRAGRRARSA